MENTRGLSEILREIQYMKDVSLMEAIILFCEEHKIEPEVLAPIIKESSSLTEELYMDAEKLRLVEPITRISGFEEWDETDENAI